jgi:hypothetical protein
MKVIHQDCDPSLSEDRTLPNNSFLIEYILGEVSHYDIAAASKSAEIFDHYYDKYKKDFVTMNQTEGRVNPKLWGNPEPAKSKKGRKS